MILSGVGDGKGSFFPELNAGLVTSDFSITNLSGFQMSNSYITD